MNPAVLVVSYRRPDLLAACLASVAAHLPGAPVLVQDNASDASPAVRELATRHPEVDWTFSPVNAGFAAAVNTLAGRAPAGADLLLLNPDAVLVDGLTASLAALRGPRVAAVAPRGATDGTGGDTAHRPLTLTRALVSDAGLADRFRGRRWSDLPAAPVTTVDGYLSGACLLLARAAWDELGGFDPSFFLYGEEADWQRRAVAAGWTLQLADDVGYAHTAAGTVDDDPALRRRSRDLLHEAQAHRLQTTAGTHRADLYAAGVGLLERVQRSKRVAPTVAVTTDRPAVVFSTNTLDVGGAERLQVHLANALAERGFDVTMVCVQRFGPLVSTVSPAVRLLRRPWWSPLSLPDHGPTVLLTNETNTEAGLALGWRTGRGDRRWFVAAHTPVAPDVPTYGPRLVAAMRRADGLIALAASHRDDLLRHHALGDRVTVIGNGVPPAPAAAPVDDHGPVRLAYVGRIVEAKNPHLLVTALDRVDPGLDWTLDVWGDGPDRARLEALTPARLADRVRWRGWAAEPGEAVAAAHLLCQPSGSEVFPMVILEGMARGVAVAASGVAAVPEILDHGRAGRVVAPVTVEAWTHALDDLLADRPGLRALGAAGRARMLAHHTLDHTVDRYEQLIRTAFA